MPARPTGGSMASTHSSRGDVSESPTFRDQGDFKNLPLHAALANSRPTAEIIPLLEFHDASVADDQGCLPLHYACGNNAPPGVVSLLVKAFPGAVAKKDNAGQLPLHWAAQRKAVLEVVTILLEANGKLAAERDSLGRTPLHVGAAGHASLAVLDALHDAHPEAAWQRDLNGSIPLHHAAAYRLAPEGVGYLLRTYPDAAQIRDCKGRAPLHLASAKQAPVGSVEAIIDAFPEAARIVDQEGKLPIHYAVSRGAPVEVVHLLLKVHPNGAMERSARSNLLPLHVAAACAAPPAVVAELLAVHAEAVRIADGQGRLPLHMAVGGKAPIETVIELLAAYPDATRVPDADGLLPLHVACTSGAPAEVLGQLLAVSPDSARVKTRGMRPVFHWLLEKDPQSALDLAAIVSRSQAVSRAVVHDLAQIPALAPALAAAVAKDRELPFQREAPARRGSSPSFASSSGREALEVACAECRRAMLLHAPLLRRYDLEPLPAYRSATSYVFFAVDSFAEEGSAFREVALKFTRKPAKFARESDRRAPLSADFVVPVLRTHSALAAVPPGALIAGGVSAGGGSAGVSGGDPTFAEEAELRGLWPHLLAMERGQRTLAAALAERTDPTNLARRDWEATRRVARQVAEAVLHLHSHGLVHGELKPSNILLVGDRWKLTDMDAAASFAAGEYISDRCSSAFCPPEMVYLAEDGSVSLKVVPERGVLEAWEPASLKAQPAFDAWAFGCVLFHMVTGAPLWPEAREDDSLPEGALRALAGWRPEHLETRLRGALEAALPSGLGAADGGGGVLGEGGAALQGAAAAEPRPAESRAAAVALLRWLLRRDPAARPQSFQQVLRHRFMDPLSGLDERQLAQEGPSLYETLSNSVYSAIQSNGALGAAVAAATAPTGAISSTLWRGMSTALAFATAGRAGGGTSEDGSTDRAGGCEYRGSNGGEQHPRVGPAGPAAGPGGGGAAAAAAAGKAGSRGGTPRAGDGDEGMSPFASFRKRGCASAFSMQSAAAFG